MSNLFELKSREPPAWPTTHMTLGLSYDVSELKRSSHGEKENRKDLCRMVGRITRGICFPGGGPFAGAQ